MGLLGCLEFFNGSKDELEDGMAREEGGEEDNTERRIQAVEAARGVAMGISGTENRY